MEKIANALKTSILKNLVNFKMRKRLCSFLNNNRDEMKECAQGQEIGTDRPTDRPRAVTTNKKHCGLW